MCSISVIEFFVESIKPIEFKDKKILEIGSKYVNGSIRPIIEKFLHPNKYVGIDIEYGKYVDLIISAEKISEYFGEESFDVVIATELLEHVKDWRAVIENIKKVVKKGGYIYITTRSKGFPYHGYPHDYWRFEIEDIYKIFSDFEIVYLRKDPSAPGIFLKARKPINYIYKDISELPVYSMILGRKTKNIHEIEDMPLFRKFKLKIVNRISEFLLKIFLFLNIKCKLY